MHRFRRVLPVLLLLFGLWQIGLPAQAQDNLLKNPGFEGTYSGIGTPDGWDGGSITSPRTESWMNLTALFFPHTADKAYEGTRSQNIGRGDATFSAGVWQKIDNIQAGTRLRFTAWVYLENQAGANSRIRVGIDSNNYGSPLDDMTWSSYATVLNSWQELSVEATVPAGYVTVYVFATQDWPKESNQVYIDQASLKVVGTGQPISQATAAPGSTGVAVVPVVPTTRPQVYAPSVSAQDKDASDGITHTVQSGDTLAAIAVAYGTTVTKIVELNGIDRRAMLALGQKIIISKPSGGSTTTTDTQPTSAAPAATVPSETVAEPTKADTSAAQPTTAVQQPTVAQPTTDGNALSSILGTPTQAAAAPTTAAPAENTAVSSPTPQPTDVPAPSATTAPTEAAALPTNTLAATSVAVAATPLEAGVCVTLFEDKNQNRFQEETESVLPGGVITLRDLQGKDVATHQTTADAKPFCFTNLTPATYNLGVVPPTGYGLTTTSALTVNVQVATQFQVNIGAAQGVTPPVTPTLDTTLAQAVTDVDAASTSNGPLVLIFVGLIAVVAIGAGVLIFVIRRL